MEELAQPPLTPQDAEHLRLLAIFHRIMSGLTICFSSMFIMHVIVGVSALVNPEAFSNKPSDQMPPMFAWLFMLGGGAAVAFGWTVGILNFFVAKRLEERKGATLINVVSALNCLNMPFGTLLGVFTIVVLQRPQVKAVFGKSAGFP